MNREEAKQILQVYRPHGQDAQDPQFAAALALVAQDQELGAWFAAEQAFDLAVSRQVQATPVPPQLQMAILAGGKVLEQLVWWRLVNWPRVLACTLVLFVGMSLFLFSYQRTQGLIAASQEAIQLAELRSAMVAFQNGDMGRIRAFLTRCHAPSDFEVPLALRKLPITSCTLVGVQDQTAVVLSFRLIGNNQFRLLVMPHLASHDLPEDNSPRFVESEQAAAAIWTDGKNTYVLTGQVPSAALRRLLSRRALRQADYPQVPAEQVRLAQACSWGMARSSLASLNRPPPSGL